MGGRSAARSNRIRRLVETCESRSEEHTSELQSQSNLVCRLLLEKKKNAADAHIDGTHFGAPFIVSSGIPSSACSRHRDVFASRRDCLNLRVSMRAMASCLISLL